MTKRLPLSGMEAKYHEEVSLLESWKESKLHSTPSSLEAFPRPLQVCGARARYLFRAKLHLLLVVCLVLVSIGGSRYCSYLRWFEHGQSGHLDGVIPMQQAL